MYASLRRLLLRALAITCLSTVAAFGAGCSKPQDYEAEVQIVRVGGEDQGQRGPASTIDIELSYIDCPGTQSEVVRGSAEFAACVGKLAVGDRAKVTVHHRDRGEGHWESGVVKLNGCARVAEVDDPASFTLARECRDTRVNGVVVGFECNYRPDKALVAKCPWFRR